MMDRIANMLTSGPVSANGLAGGFLAEGGHSFNVVLEFMSVPPHFARSLPVTPRSALGAERTAAPGHPGGGPARQSVAGTGPES